MKAARPITGRHVLFGFLAFFGLIFAANAMFVYFALSSWTGLETRQHYNEGLAYNRILAADDRQKTLGWQARIEVEQMAGHRARVLVTLFDRGGNALDNVDVSSSFIRPTHEGHDFSGALAPLGNGRYAAEFDVPLAGQWDVRVAANRGDNRYYKQDRVDLR